MSPAASSLSKTLNAPLPDDVAALSARITDLAAHDPDPDVRRLAGYRR